MSIEKYNFSDKNNVLHVNTTENLVVITCLWTQSEFNKPDAIALAKHFKLIVEGEQQTSKVNINGQDYEVHEEVAEQFAKYICRAKELRAELDEVAELERKLNLRGAN